MHDDTANFFRCKLLSECFVFRKNNRSTNLTGYRFPGCCSFCCTRCLKMVWLWASQWLCLMIGLATGTLPEFPNPQKEFRLCGRKDPSFVCDPDFLLDMGDVDRLNKLAKEFRRSTTCLCSGCEDGISIGIFVKRNLTQESLKLQEREESGKSTAEIIRKRWRLGKCDDDVVILLLTALNISDYSMGPAVADILPGEIANLIMKDCKIHFLSGWYYQGLESVVNSFNDAIIKFQRKKKSFSKNLIIGISLGVGVLFILVIFGIVLLKRQNNRRKEGCENIYESVPTLGSPNRYLNEKRNEYQLDKTHKQSNYVDEDDDSDEDTNLNGLSGRFSSMKRQLSAVTEESSEDNETLKDRDSMSFNTYTNSQLNKERPLQVTEL